MHCFPTAMKETSFEEAIGIPLIIRDPTDGKAKVIDDPVCTEDIFPTICGLCGVPVPDGLPGMDCSGLVRGEIDSLDREAILIEMVEERRQKGTFYGHSMRGIRTKNWKYTVLKGPRGGQFSDQHVAPWQLFNLENDPLEQRNLVEQPEYSAKVKQMHTKLAGMLENAGDFFSI